MKKTQRKDALRNIRKQLVSYLSILVIAMLAVMAFLGIRFAARAIADNGNAFYDEARFRDVEVLSTRLLTEDDLAALRAAEGVSEAEGGWQTSGYALSKDANVSVNVVSLNSRVNRPVLISGRLPETAGECAVEKLVAEDLAVGPGDRILVQSPLGGTADYLTEQEFTVTGIVFHPNNVCYPLHVPGNRDVIVTAEVFDREALDGCYMVADLLLKDAAGLDRFSGRYRSVAQEAIRSLETLGEERGALRDREIDARYRGEIDENQKKLDEAGAELSDARRQLDEGAAEIEENRAKLKEAEETLAETRRQLIDGEAQLEDADRVLKDTKRQLDEGARQLADARRQLDEAEAELADGKSQLDDGERMLFDGGQELANAARQLADAEAQIAEGEQQLADAKRQLDDGLAELSAGQAQLASAEQQLTTAYAQIETRKQSIRDAVKAGIKQAITDAGYPLSAAESAAIDGLPWATAAGAPDLNDTSVDATWFQLTNTIGFPLSTIDYASTAATAMANYSSLFDQAMTLLQLQGIDTSGIVAVKSTVQSNLQTYLALAAALENDYNANVAQLQTWNAGRDAYRSGEAALVAASLQYRDGQIAYENGAAELELAKEQLADGRVRYEEGRKAFEEKSAEFAEAKQKYEDGLAQYEDGLAQYEASLAQYQLGRRQYEQGLADWRSGLAQLEDGRAQYEEGLLQLEDGRRQLEEAERTLAEKEEEYADALAQYEDGLLQLEEARETLSGLDPTRWVVLGASGNAAFSVVNNNVKNVTDMGMTFALLFVLVGALVIFATVGRIVDEQRRLVGATKALGLYNREIFAKYLCYGLSATAAGMLLGVALGYFAIQKVVLATYARLYVYDAYRKAFAGGLTAIVLACGLALSALTVWSACSDLLRSTATQLMQEKAPSARRKSSGRKALSLYWRLIFLNMSTDKKRVAVTVVSVAGCCALLVTGFTMRSSVMGGLNRQFEEVSVYDAQITYDPDTSETAGEEIRGILQDAGTDWMEMHTAETTYSVGGKLSSGQLLCGDLADLDRYYIRRDAASGEPLADSDDGLYIHVCTAKAYGLSVGDEIVLYDAAMAPHPVSVAGIYNIYAGREMVLSEKAYVSVFGQEPEKNAFLLFLNGAEPETLWRKIGDVRGAGAITASADLRETYQSYAVALDLIAAILTAVAGMMAYFILLNLANMYINQKKRELTIMRVNGFTMGESVRYVAGEAVATTLIGILLGFAAGTVLARRVIALLESANLRFPHEIDWQAWGLAALITAGFSVVIYAFALRKVRHLKLTDIA